MPTSIRGDQPIRSLKEDLLSRTKLARSIADQILQVEPSEGFVVGVIGPWGSGKTSLINLVLDDLRTRSGITVIEFNPWMFSGADQLVERFFSELAGQLGEKPKKKLRVAAAGLAKYGKLVAPLRYVPMAEPWVSIISKVPEAASVLKDFLGDSEEGGIAKQRHELEEELAQLKQPILIVVDDIDRLTPSETRDIFKLVRLTANFPNVIYLVAFDRNRVEAALSDSGLSGRDYLEKIIQLPVDIPSVPAVALHNQIMEALNRVVDSQGILDNPQQFASRRWDTSYHKVIRPLIRNMRDLRRYSASLPGTLQQLEGKVSLIDVFTIEAVRIFRPDIFAAIADHQDALGYESEEFFVRDLNKERRKLQIAAFRESDKSPNSITGDLLDVLFPAAVSISEGTELEGSSIQEWTRERRVATRPVLAFYLERVAGTILKAQWIAEQLPELLGDSGHLEAFMGKVEADLWPDVFFSLPTFEDRIPQEDTVQAACNLINFASRSLDRQTRLIFQSPVRTAFGVAYRAVGRQPRPEDRITAVTEILRCLEDLEDKVLFLQWVGPGDDAREHQLIGTDEHNLLAKALRKEIRETPSSGLVEQCDLFHLLNWMSESADDDEPEPEFEITDEFGNALLRSAARVSDRAFLREPESRSEKTIEWDFLIKLFGTEEAVVQFASNTKPLGDDDSLSEAVDLVLKRAK